MALNMESVGVETVTDRPWTWAAKDTLLYAVSVGAGNDPEANEIALTTQNSHRVTQQVLPSFPVVMGMGSGEPSMAELGDFALTQVLHGGQRVTVHGPIPPAGSATITRKVAGMYDLGSNALIELHTAFRDTATDALLAESTTEIFVRGEGGFGGEPAAHTGWKAEERKPDHTVVHTTAANQALIYRLNGDHNPLHSDPAFAARAGFSTPILHGLCTYGFAARALVSRVLGADTTRFASMSARFSSPVTPGEALTTAIWKEEGRATFQTFAGDRVVLDRGEFTAAW